MGGGDIIAIVVSAAIIGLALFYIYRAKKRGKGCIGCPDSATCGGKCGGNCAGCSCGCSKNKDE